MSPEHRTVQVDDGRTLDLSGQTFHRLHGAGRDTLDLPNALRYARATRTVTSDTGWQVAAGRLAGAQSFLAIQAPAHDHTAMPDAVFGLRLGAGADAAEIAAAMTPPLRGLFNRVPNPTDPELLRYDDRLWQTVTRIHEIAQNLPPIPEPLPPSVRPRRWVDHVFALEWAAFSTEADAAPWRDLRLRGNDSFAYAAAGHTPEWSAPWIRENFHVSEAERLTRLGWPPHMALAILDVCDPAESGESGEEEALRDADDWMCSNLPPRTAVLACAAGLTLGEATAPDADLNEAHLAALAALRGVTIHLPYLQGETSVVSR